MFDFKRFAGGVVLATFAATAVAADTFVPYGEAEGWSIYTNTDDNTCVAERHDENGMIVQMGITRNHKMAYLGVFTKDQPGVTKGDKGDFIIDIDGELFHGDVTGMKGNITDGYSGAYILTDNPDFIEAVKTKNTLKAINADVIVEISLKGTAAAIDMGRECNAAAQ